MSELDRFVGMTWAEVEADIIARRMSEATSQECLIYAICAEVAKEVTRAVSQHGPMHSAHEGWAVILEEVDELWEQVRMKRENRDPDAMRKEAIQIAAMGVRFVLDVCGGKHDPR